MPPTSPLRVVRRGESGTDVRATRETVVRKGAEEKIVDQWDVDRKAADPVDLADLVRRVRVDLAGRPVAAAVLAAALAAAAEVLAVVLEADSQADLAAAVSPEDRGVAAASPADLPAVARSQADLRDAADPIVLAPKGAASAVSKPAWMSSIAVSTGWRRKFAVFHSHAKVAAWDHQPAALVA